MSGAPHPLALLGEWELGTPVATLAAAGAAYALGVRRVRAWPRRRSAAFGLGLSALLVALQSGVDAWSDRLQSVHMVQHTLMTLVAAPLLASGAPVRLALGALRGGARRRLAAALRHPVVRLLGHPAAGCAALAGALIAIHLTPLYDLAAREPVVHAGEHALLLGAGLMLWAPLVGADPAPHRAGAAARMGAVLALMAPMGGLSAVLLTAAPRYPTYARAAQAAGVDPADDQRLAAAIMWVGGSVVLTTTLLAVVGAALWQEEARMRRREAVSER